MNILYYLTNLPMSATDQLSFIPCIMKNGKIENLFLDLLQLHHRDAETIFKTIFECLEKSKIEMHLICRNGQVLHYVGRAAASNKNLLGQNLILSTFIAGITICLSALDI